MSSQNLSNEMSCVLFERLLKEKNNFVLANLLGQEYDFNIIREIATILKNRDAEFYNFNIDGSDGELWDSIKVVLSEFEP